MRTLAFFFGLVLLLPGGCSIYYITRFLPAGFRSTYNDPYLPFLELVWAVCFVVSFVGVLLIRKALCVERDDRRRTGDPPAKPD